MIDRLQACASANRITRDACFADLIQTDATALAIGFAVLVVAARIIARNI
jgi:hypothetical protein